MTMFRAVLAALAVSFVSSSYANKVLVLDGQTSYVEVPEATVLDLPYRSPVAFCLWFKFEGGLPSAEAVLTDLLRFSRDH